MEAKDPAVSHLMHTPKVDFLSNDGGKGLQPAGKPPVNFFSSIALFAATFIVSFGFGRMTLSQTAPFDLSGIEKIPFIGGMSHLIGSPDRALQGEKEDRINILLLGMGGAEHDGPFLTDTIIIASIKPSDQTVALLSVPRDLLVPLPLHGWNKINAANAYGELKNPGHGADDARDVLQNVFGIGIPYYIRVDFSGFRKLVDDVGGVDIDVDRAFTDMSYPTGDYGYQVVSFSAGIQHMNGERALRYTRSRHGNDGEGSDFARARRQQQVISALKGKLLAGRTFRDPSAIVNVLSTLKTNVATNLQLGEIVRLARMAQAMDRPRILRKVIDNGVGSPITDSFVGGAYVLLPKQDDWTGLRDIASRIFAIAEEDKSLISSASPSATSRPTVEIRNGTERNGLAKTMAGTLTSKGFEVVRISNATNFNHARTLLYDLTKGGRATDLEQLKTQLTDPLVIAGPPKPDGSEAAPANFVVVLGRQEP